MDDATRVVSPDPATLAAEVVELRAELVALRAQLASEVRTRRVVVVDDVGNERIIASATSNHAEVEVHASEASEERDGRPTKVGIYVNEDDSTRRMGFDLWGDGESFGGISCHEVDAEHVSGASRSLGQGEWTMEFAAFRPSGRPGMVLNHLGVAVASMAQFRLDTEERNFAAMIVESRRQKGLRTPLAAVRSRRNEDES